MLTNLINDLLDLAKINSLNFKFNNDYFDMQQLFQNAVETVKFQAGQRDVLLVTKYEAQIQNPKSELYGKIFENQEDISKIFRQVFGD